MFFVCAYITTERSEEEIRVYGIDRWMPVWRMEGPALSNRKHAPCPNDRNNVLPMKIFYRTRNGGGVGRGRPKKTNRILQGFRQGD
jgi:hypothetical protein